MGRRMRIVLFPVVDVEEVFTPWNRLALSQRKEALPVHMQWLLQSHSFHDRGCNVDVGNELIHNGTLFDHRGTLHEQRHPTGGFIRHAFVDQTVLTKHVAVIAHIDN